MDERDSVARCGVRVAERLDSAGALDERTLLAHGVHLDGDEAAVVARAKATVAHNARSNMNNSVGRASLGVLGGRVALGTDGIGSDMFEESRAAFFRLREDDLGAGAGWPLAPLAESARVAARSFGEPLLGTLEPGRARRPRRARLRRPDAAGRGELRGALDLRPLVAKRPRRDGRRANGR